MRRKKDQEDQLFYEINNYYKDIKLKAEINPSKVHQKETKLSIHCSSKVPEKYKRKSIKGYLHCSRKIVTVS